jgi:hypothetical protein
MPGKVRNPKGFDPATMRRLKKKGCQKAEEEFL